jgi:biotin carboxyl carrier protein
MIVEAMKVEHRIHAPVAGTVSALHFAEGDRCDKDDLLLELEPAAESHP